MPPHPPTGRATDLQARQHRLERCSPSRCSNTLRTSSLVSTTGSRFGFFGRLISPSQGESTPSTSPCRKSSAASACSCVDAATWRSFARCEKKCLDLDAAQFARMSLAVEKDEAARPVDVRALGANAVVLVANALANLIAETWLMVPSRAPRTLTYQAFLPC